MIFGLFKNKPDARPLLDPTPRPAMDWIIANNDIPLTATRVGRLETPEGQVAVIDPMIDDRADFIAVPKSGCDMVLFENNDPEDYRSSKLALIFGEAPVTSGKRKDWCSVDSVSISPVTPASLAALNQYQEKIGQRESLYTHFFEQFEHINTPDAKLPNGAHLPYFNAPDDGTYPVCELRSADGDIVGVYVDLMGRTEDYQDWLIPPNDIVD